MATKLKPGEFDFTKQSELTTTEKANYPWEQWLDGDVWKITEGEDFQTHPLMMERIIRTRATGRGAKVRMRHVAVNGNPWGVIVLQRTDIQGPEEQKQTARREKRAAASKNRAKVDGKKLAAPKAAAKKAPAKKATAKAAAKKAAPTKRPARKLAAVQ
jgi:hypothetical protein